MESTVPCVQRASYAGGRHRWFHCVQPYIRHNPIRHSGLRSVRRARHGLNAAAATGSEKRGFDSRRRQVSREWSGGTERRPMVISQCMPATGPSCRREEAHAARVWWRARSVSVSRKDIARRTNEDLERLNLFRSRYHSIIAVAWPPPPTAGCWGNIFRQRNLANCFSAVTRTGVRSRAVRVKQPRDALVPPI